MVTNLSSIHGGAVVPGTDEAAVSLFLDGKVLTTDTTKTVGVQANPLPGPPLRRGGRGRCSPFPSEPLDADGHDGLAGVCLSAGVHEYQRPPPVSDLASRLA